MSTITRPPVYWKGTPEEYNRVPVDDQVMLKSLSGGDREKEAERLLAIARNEHYNPEKERAKSDTSSPEKKAPVPTQFYGIRNWTEPVDGVSAERIRDCILYLLDVAKQPWYLANCNNKAFVRRNVHRMNEAVPEDYHWDPNAVLGTKRQHLDGENHPVVLTVVQKKHEDMTDKDRKELRDRYGVNDSTIHFLAKLDCPHCHGKGFMDISDYPDDPTYERLDSSDACYCVWQ